MLRRLTSSVNLTEVEALSSIPRPDTYELVDTWPGREMTVVMPELEVPMLVREDRFDLLLRISLAALDFAMSIEFRAFTGDFRTMSRSELSD